MSQLTRISCLTPSGTGAIASLALRGPDAWPWLRDCFQPASNRPLPDSCPQMGTVMFGRIGQESADEVIVAVTQSSPEVWLEIHCHGGPQVVAWLTELFTERGATRCSWPAMVRATEKRLEAIACEYLAKTTTQRTAAILLEQQQGAVRRTLEQIRDLLEAESPDAASQLIQSILRFTDLGKHLVSPWRVVVAGPPNAGKSSLVNALAGFQRSIVTPIAGTTRDAVSTFLAIDGWPVELIDTAGIHNEAQGLEYEGIGSARGQMGNCDLCLWITDVTVPPISLESELRAYRVPYLAVANKIDEPAIWPTEDHCAVSALTGQGLTKLCQQISERLVSDVPMPGTAIPFCSDLLAALQALDRAVADSKIASALAICNSWL